MRLTTWLCAVAMWFAVCDGLRASQTRTKSAPSQGTVTITLHSVAVDDRGQRTVSSALNLFDPKLAFETGQRLLLRYKANFDSYVYIINVSANAASLQYPPNSGSNTLVPAQITRDLQFLFTGEAGKEDLIMLISSSQLEIANITDDASGPITEQTRPRFSSSDNTSPPPTGILIENYSPSDFIAVVGKYFTFMKRPLASQQFSSVRLERKKDSFLMTKPLPRRAQGGGDRNQFASVRLSVNHSGVATSTLERTRLDNSISTDRRAVSKRTALVIGNARYQAMGLWFASDVRDTVHNDANSIANVLRQIGFEVILEHDLTQSEMLKSIQKLTDEASGDGTVLVYYSGIGREFENRSYLLPVDASPPDRPGFKDTLIDVQGIIEMLNGESTLKRRTTILLLDAGPFGEVDVPANTIVGFGSETHRHLNPLKLRQQNSIYTEALLRYLREPGLRIDDFFNRVRQYVNSKTKDDELGPQSPRANYTQRSFLFHP